MKYKIGDQVLVNRLVQGNSNHGKRVLQESCWFKPIQGIVIGFSFIFTGEIRSDYRSSYLHKPKSHKVIVIAPITYNNRYVKPIKAFEKNISRPIRIY